MTFCPCMYSYKSLGSRARLIVDRPRSTKTSHMNMMRRIQCEYDNLKFDLKMSIFSLLKRDCVVRSMAV